MKKIISLILSATLIFTTFTACSVLKPSFAKIESELCIDKCENQQMCLKDNLLFVTSEKTYYDYDNGENEYEPDIEKAETRFVLYDLEKDEIICQKDIETKVPLGIFDVLFDDDKIVVMQDEKKIYYDYDLNEIETKKFNYETDNTMALGKSDFGEDMICTTKGLYREYCENFEALIFKAEPNNAYIFDKNMATEYVICSGKRIITQESTFNDDKNIILSTTVKVLDFEESKVLNSYTLDYEIDNKICNVLITGAMDDDRAVLAVCTDTAVESDESYESKVEYYKWNYNENSEPAELKAEKCDYESINDKAEKLASDIGKNYNININVNIDTVPNYNSDDYSPDEKYYIDFKINDVITLYDNLFCADKILSNFPKGMVSRLNSFNLYIVNYITGCGAYANTTVDAFTDEIQYYVVAGVHSINDLPHELMHCFDDYILNNLDNSPLTEPYMALSSVNIYDESFYNEHDEDDKLNYVYDGTNKDTAEFVTEYATTNVLEDKAELFQLLYKLGTDYEKYKDDGMDKISAPVIRKKAELICKVLREAFPEIKDTPVWETALNK